MSEELSIEEIEKYIIGRKIEEMNLEEIRKFVEAQGNTIILNQRSIIKKQEEIERLNNIINKVRDYFENHTFNYDDLMLIKPSDVFEILNKENKND